MMRSEQTTVGRMGNSGAHLECATMDVIVSSGKRYQSLLTAAPPLLCGGALDSARVVAPAGCARNGALARRRRKGPYSNPWPYCLAWLWIGLILLCPSCATSPIASAGKPSSIQEINLLSMPMALNLDDTPGADGLAVKIFAISAASPKPVPIPNGKLEILLFDGTTTAGDSYNPDPLHIWTFTADDLKAFMFTKAIGSGYDLLLVWGANQPKQSRVTIVARYTPVKGPPIASGPNAVTVLSN